MNLLDEYIRGVYLETTRSILQKGGDMKECIKLWRLYYQTLDSVVSAPYLGFCKVYNGVRDCIWLQYGAKALFFYPNSIKLLE